MKVYSVVFTPDAKDDMNSIYDFIAVEKEMPEVAIAYIRKLKEACSRLRQAPIRGRNREDLRKNLRILALDKSAVAAFEVDEKREQVKILNIFYGGQDYDAIMGDDENK